MATSRAISSDDPQAIEKLEGKLQARKGLQEHMKGVNAHWRKTGSCLSAPGLTDGQAAMMDKRIADAAAAWECVPYTEYDLRYNYRDIQRLEKRIAEITRYQEVGFSGWAFFCGRAEANTGLNRLQLFFSGKPNEIEQRQLKFFGFKWAPSQGAWQRQLNDNAIDAADRLPFLKPLDGRSVRDHQPKAPVREDAVR